jgi:hypothetical protein
MKDEALRLALNVLMNRVSPDHEAITTIKQVLEQSVAASDTSQEPVAKIEKTQHEPFAWYVDFGNEDEPNYFSKTKPDEPRASVKPLYTAPPKRKWQGLTDDEYSQLHDGLYQQGKSLGWVVDQIEEKLKERNL